MVKGNIKPMFCPYIDNHVFYESNGAKGLFIKIKFTKHYLLRYRYLDSDIPYKSKMLFKFIFKEQLGFIIG